MNTRRQFLVTAPLGLLGVTAACRDRAQAPGARSAAPDGAPPTFGALPEVGPEVSPATFAEAEKLVQVGLTESERAMAAGSWRRSMAAMLERRTGPRRVAIDAGVAPATRLESRAARREGGGPTRDRFVPTAIEPGPLPATDADIAFAPVTRLSRWIETRAAHLRAPDAYLSGSHRALRLEAPLRHHADARAGARCRRSRPTRRSPRAGIAGRCTASRGAPRTCSTRPASRPPTAPSRSATAFPPTTPSSSSACATRAPSSWRS